MIPQPHIGQIIELIYRTETKRGMVYKVRSIKGHKLEHMVRFSCDRRRPATRGLRMTGKTIMSELQIKKATRTGINPLIVAYSESGCGKTYTSLVLARGIAGPNGRIIVGDSESGRASLYADIPIFGGYDTIAIEDPFSPKKYIDVINLIESSGASVGIIDSGSHEWEGVGGVTDMAAENEKRSGKGLHVWKDPKFQHALFVQRLMRSKIPWIVCLRAKYKTRQGKDANGKTQIVKDDHVSPIQAEDFIFEATCHFEILPNHTIHLTKHSHPGLKACFPEDGKWPIEIKHGEAIAKWCAAGGGPAKGPVKTDSEMNDLELIAKGPILKPLDLPLQTPGQIQIKKKLWDLTVKKHFGVLAKLQQYLWDENLLDPSKALADLTESELRAVYQSTESKIREG